MIRPTTRAIDSGEAAEAGTPQDSSRRDSGSDSVARLGGDEFVAILESQSLERSPHDEARAVAGKLLAALTPPVRLEHGPQQVGASLGIAMFPDHAQSKDRLIHLADLAMYEAKRSGDNQSRLAQAASPG